MRGAAGEQVVRDWDTRGSPLNRRIVTRSNRDEAQEDLIELAEDGDVEVNEGDADEMPREEVVRVEIEHEDGTIQELDAEEGEAEAENENWDDESMTEEVVWDATLMHLAGTIDAPEGLRETGHGDETEQVVEEGVQGPDQEDMEIEATSINAPPPQGDTTPDEQLNSETVPQKPDLPVKQPEEAPQVPQLKSALRRTSQFGPIPAGFVSPVKERQRRTINQVRLSNANRRRTLPVNFAAQNASVVPVPVQEGNDEEATVPQTVREETETDPVEDAQDDTLKTEGSTSEVLVLPSGSVSEETMQAALDVDDSDVELGVVRKDSEVAHVDTPPVDSAHDDNAWEDVDEEVPEEGADVDMEENDEEQVPEESTEVRMEGEAAVGDETAQHAENDNTQEILPSCEEQQAQGEGTIIAEDTALRSPTKQDSSPVGSITAPHPRLPLRRSPRRQSTSPVRKSGILPSSTRSHLVAFTPIKLPVYSSSDGLQSSPLPVGAVDDSMDVDNDNPTPMPQPARSSSAPPEEPQMSPRRPKQPRISDDTALLQAFLNRAAESKTSKESTTTAKRESIENRRDSTSVRQALASPGPAKTIVGDVLADLDPNSPSPRKQSLAASLANAAEDNGKPTADQDEDELALNATPTKRTSSRKSGRVKKKAQVLPASTYNASTSGGPNRISIRSADSVVVLKKSEAQEIAQVTRNNTRKNKSGAVLPPMRLTRLAAEKLARADEIGPPDEDEMEVDVPAKPTGRRAVKWAETLESFHEGANEPEMSMLSDELNVPAEESNVPPAKDTPSKPAKLRRLRTPRPTASSSGATKTEAEAATVPAAAETAKPPRPTKRSSRIATPAKLPGAAKSLLPDGLTDSEEPAAPAPAPAPAPASASRKAPVTRKKIPSSKLPAPAATSISSAAGKENSLIASPPKKRPTARSTAPSASAVPKLDFSAAGEVGLKASPAKKPRAQVLFGDNGDVSIKRDEPLGLGSPAKKRSRRG